MPKAHRNRPATYTGVPKAQTWPIAVEPPAAPSVGVKGGPDGADADNTVPSVSAPKSEWVAWAEANGYETEGLGKRQLQALAR